MRLSGITRVDMRSRGPLTIHNVETSLDEFTRARKPKAVEMALQRIRARIAAGDLHPGEQIRQHEMAEELGVSRMPLREALNVLAEQGLLMHRPNAGYFVAKRAPNELAQIRRILQLLENELLSSIEWPDAACIAELRELNRQMRVAASAEDWTPLVRLNREFHLKMFSLSPSKLILAEVKRLWALADLFITTKMADSQARLRTVEEHERLIDCLARQDMAQCLEMMELHRASTSKGLPTDIEAARSGRQVVAG
jgi:DNA-binding GntR family transcriptional regulator